jgi:hypothetical protein
MKLWNLWDCREQMARCIIRPDTERNVLYYGDNLEILRSHIADESVDLFGRPMVN